MDVSDSGGIALSSVIDYAPAVLDDACTHVTTALERPAVEGAEIGGVLFGTHSARGVIVLALRPVESMPGDAPAFEQAIALHQTDASLAGTEPVGCFVSHPRDSLVLRPSERDIFNRHFPQPRQIVLVVRPGMIGSFRAATIGRAAGKPQGVVLNSFIIRRIRNGLAHPPPDVPTWLPAPAPMNVIAPTTSSEKPPAPALAPSRTLRPRSLRQEAPRPTPASPVPARKAWAWQPAVAIVCVLAVTLAAFVYLRSRVPWIPSDCGPI